MKQGKHLRARGRAYSAALALALSVAVAPLTLAQRATAQHWVATWGTAQQSYRPPATAGRGAAPGMSGSPQTQVPGGGSLPSQGTAVQGVAAAQAAAAVGRGGPARRFGIPQALPGLNNQTVRMILRTSIGGSVLRVRLSQAFGASAVTLGAAHIAVRAPQTSTAERAEEGAAIVAGSDRVLTFSGQPTATIYAGQTLISDPVKLTVAPSSDLAISLYVPGETGPPTTHTFGLRPTYISRQGDVTGALILSDMAARMESYYWLTGVDVLAPASAGTLVTFGDSITDGDQSTPDTNGTWPAVLAARLQRDPRTARLGIGVVNAGISGNRVLGDNTSGLARLVRDAIAVPGVRWITVLEGINDITAATRAGQAGTTFTADTLIAAYRQIIEAAHLHRITVIGCTITPYGGSNVYTEAGEAIRQAVNAWIRTSGAFDAVFDFDAATRDPQSPARMRAAADSPDMLHPANPGYKLMADAIDLAVFVPPAPTR